MKGCESAEVLWFEHDDVIIVIRIRYRVLVSCYAICSGMLYSALVCEDEVEPRESQVPSGLSTRKVSRRLPVY